MPNQSSFTEAAKLLTIDVHWEVEFRKVLIISLHIPTGRTSHEFPASSILIHTRTHRIGISFYFRSKFLRTIVVADTSWHAMLEYDTIPSSMKQFMSTVMIIREWRTKILNYLE